MKRNILGAVMTLVVAFASRAVPAWAAPITGFQSYTPVLTGGTVATFEGFPEFDRISTQAAPGMTFSQTGGGLPMIDNYNQNGGAFGCSGAPWCYGYGASSGSGVLTGSPDGGNVVTTAGIIVTFASLQSDVQAFLSDTSPLGNYVITAYGSSHNVLGTVTVLQANTLPPGYTGCGNSLFPAPGCTPLPGIFVGFKDTVAEIQSLQIGPSTGCPGCDAFAVDDVRFGTVPEPSSLLMLGTGVVGLAGILRRKLML